LVWIILLLSKKTKKPVTNQNKKSNQSEKIWKEYTATLVKWKLAYELWQKVGKEAMIMYIKALETLGPDMKLPKNMPELWEKAWMESGVDQIKQFGNEWQNMLKASGLESIIQFNKEWEKFWTKPGFDPSKSYLEALKQFTETWQNMWKK